MNRTPWTRALVFAVGTSALVPFVVGRNAVAQAPAPSPSSSNTSKSSSDNRAMAETLFFTARGLMEAKRYAEACTKFEESYRLDPAAGTLLNMAVCHETIGKIASAWGEFRQALFDAKKADRKDRIELAQAGVDRLQADLPYLTIDVPKEARLEGLEVVRNGSPLQAGAWGTELPVDPGEVEITARAPGYKPKTLKIKIEKKEHKSVEVPLLEKAPAAVVVLKEGGWSGTRKVGFGLVLTGVVGVGLGTFFGARALSARKDSDSLCPEFDGERRCSADGADAMSRARTAAWISNVGFGVGVLSLGIGTYLFVRGGNVAPERATARSWTLDVGPTPGGFRGWLTGTF